MNFTEGKRMYNFAEKLYPIHRSLTGKGVIETLNLVKDYININDNINLNIEKVATGYNAFDWVVPKEWSIDEAYIEDENGNRIIDIKNNNLHVIGYSAPIDKWVTLEELKEYIYSDPLQPDYIPYITSYYAENVGFCMSEKQKQSLKDTKYHMVIKSKLFDGYLNYGEVVIKPDSDKSDVRGEVGPNKEILFSTYICHPSMANNECSGIAVVSELIKYVNLLKNRRYTYRFLFIPETIGSVVYISKNIQRLKSNVIAGFVVSCVGDDRAYSVIESRYGNSLSDRVINNVLSYNGEYKKYSFLERGSDERQFNAPNVDLGVVGFCRSKYGEYPKYHTSGDNMDLVNPYGFQGSFNILTQVINALEYNRKYEINVLCEPQLGKRGLYPNISTTKSKNIVKNMMNFIAYADGKNDLINISNIIGVPIKDIIPIIDNLINNQLLNIISE